MIKTIVFGCMDYRFQENIQNLLKKYNLNYGDYDLVLIQGGGGNFDQLEKHLITSKKLHNPLEVILTIHEDCGFGSKIKDFNKAISICKNILGKECNISIEYLYK